MHLHAPSRRENHMTSYRLNISFQTLEKLKRNCIKGEIGLQELTHKGAPGNLSESLEWSYQHKQDKFTAWFGIQDSNPSSSCDLERT